MEQMINREIAWRIFAHEFNISTLYLSGSDERSPAYIITPTGVKCNRLFIVGVVTEVEKVGEDNAIFRARIADPTGVFTVYAGKYQPDAAIFLSELKIPSYVALVGKARKFDLENGNIRTLIRPEEVNIADEKLRDKWVLDTAERTLERIRIIEEVMGETEENLKEILHKKGVDDVLIDGIIRAMKHYKNMEYYINEIKTAVYSALKTIAGERVEYPEKAEEEYPEKAEEEYPEKAEVEEKETVEKEIEEITDPKEIVAGILDELDTGKGAPYSQVLETALSHGIDADVVEDCIKQLMSEGRCYEPKIGILRKV